MREIKFRAWDIDNKTWTFVTLGDLVCGACTIGGDKPLSGGSQTWEQYTGLKDKTVQRFTRVTSALSLPKMANMWV